MRHGMCADMLMALVENGTNTRQRVLTGTLERLGELVQDALLFGPPHPLASYFCGLKKRDSFRPFTF